MLAKCAKVRHKQDGWQLAFGVAANFGPLPVIKFAR